MDYTIKKGGTNKGNETPKTASKDSLQLADIWTRYNESFMFLQARKKRQVNQLVLLNNLQRGDQNIASTLLLTLFNRVLSALYDDKLQVKFLPSQGINQNQINTYNILAQSDYMEMQKAKLDYDWCWDTLFFGRGYVETLRFNKKKKILEPHVINPLVFGYDPYMSEVQDWRYYWKWLTKSKWDLVKLIKDGTIDGIKDPKEIPSGVDPYLWEYKTRRDQAREGIPPSYDPSNMDVFQILEFYGYDDDGDKCVYWVDKSFSTILMHEKLDLQDNDDGSSKWPIVSKEAYREPHSSIPFSVADLLDDKHRAKSVLLNLAFIAAKDQANPVYLYNSDKVDDVTQFLSRQVNQHIPVSDVEMAVAPLNKAASMSQELLSFIQVMMQEANEPIGTGTALQPNKGNAKQTATEVSIEQQLNDMAQSLQSKVLQFGEQEFWSHWFHRYAKNAEALDSKMANIVGVKGITSINVDFKDFNTDYPPGVMVYSAKEAEYKELILRRDLMQLYPDLMQSLDPDGMRNFNKFVFFPKFLQDPSLIDIMLPKTLDEIKADDENKQLEKDIMPTVADTDNHTTHIYTHYQVMPKTWATWMHIAWHEELLAQQKKTEQIQGGGQNDKGQNKVSESISFKDLPPDGQQQMAAQAGINLQGQQPGMTQPQNGQSGLKPAGQNKVGTEKRNPLAAVSPLKTAMTNQPVAH